MGDNRHAKDIDRFSRWAETYDRSMLQRLFFNPVQRFTLEKVSAEVGQPPAAVLDIGCGTGLFLRKASAQFPSAQLTGVDASAKMVEVATAMTSGQSVFRFVHGFAEHLRFPDRSYDVVVTTMSFHHWEDQLLALGEVYRVLTPGGVFALTDAIPSGWLKWFLTRSDHGHFNSREALDDMLRKVGFEVKGWFPVPHFGRTLNVMLARV